MGISSSSQHLDSDQSSAVDYPENSQEYFTKDMSWAKLLASGEEQTSLRVVKEDLNLPKEFRSKLAFLLHNVLSEKECQALIAETEKKGYEEALVNAGFGRQIMRPDIRNSKRCIIDSQEYVGELWKRIKDFIPEIFLKRKVLGLNERLRFLRYDAGEYFKPHFDGCFMRENKERSFLTFQLYLNEGFKGGATTFLGSRDEAVPVIPKTGMVLIFQHDIMHEGSELIKGRKYAVRTDVMYSAELVKDSD